MMVLEFEANPSHLCEGHLVIILDSQIFDFGCKSLRPGGLAYIPGESDERTPTGPWEVVEWPANFPAGRKAEALKLINNEIPWGCCGKCTPL